MKGKLWAVGLMVPLLLAPLPLSWKVMAQENGRERTVVSQKAAVTLTVVDLMAVEGGKGQIVLELVNNKKEPLDIGLDHLRLNERATKGSAQIHLEGDGSQRTSLLFSLYPGQDLEKATLVELEMEVSSESASSTERLEVQLPARIETPAGICYVESQTPTPARQVVYEDDYVELELVKILSWDPEKTGPGGTLQYSPTKGMIAFYGTSRKDSDVVVSMEELEINGIPCSVYEPGTIAHDSMDRPVLLFEAREALDFEGPLEVKGRFSIQSTPYRDSRFERPEEEDVDYVSEEVFFTTDNTPQTPSLSLPEERPEQQDCPLSLQAIGRIEQEETSYLMVQVSWTQEQLDALLLQPVEDSLVSQSLLLLRQGSPVLVLPFSSQKLAGQKSLQLEVTDVEREENHWTIDLVLPDQNLESEWISRICQDLDRLCESLEAEIQVQTKALQQALEQKDAQKEAQIRQQLSQLGSLKVQNGQQSGLLQILQSFLLQEAASSKDPQPAAPQKEPESQKADDEEIPKTMPEDHSQVISKAPIAEYSTCDEEKKENLERKDVYTETGSSKNTTKSSKTTSKKEKEASSPSLKDKEEEEARKQDEVLYASEAGAPGVYGDSSPFTEFSLPQSQTAASVSTGSEAPKKAAMAISTVQAAGDSLSAFGWGIAISILGGSGLYFSRRRVRKDPKTDPSASSASQKQEQA